MAGSSSNWYKTGSGSKGRVYEESDVAMRVPVEVMGMILEGGFKNQHATMTSGGDLDPAGRARWEGEAFGIPAASPPEAYPIYGYLRHRESPKSGNASIYGEVQILFKPSVRARTTVASGDSLHGAYKPAPLATPRLASLGKGAFEIASLASQSRSVPEIMDERSYFETQIHGPTTASDIARVVFGKGKPPPPDVAAKLDQLGIPWSVDR